MNDTSMTWRHCIRFVVDRIYSQTENISICLQVLRQILSGALATLTDVIMFQVSLWLGVQVMVAAVISWVFALVVNFCVTRYYVFGQIEKQKFNWLFQFLMYIPAALVSLGIIQVMLFVFVIKIGYHPLLVKILSIPVVFVWTVCSSRYLVFKKSGGNW